MADPNDELRRISAIRDEITPLMTQRDEMCPEGARPSAENLEAYVGLTDQISALGTELQGCQAAYQTAINLERDDEALAESMRLSNVSQIPRATDEYRENFLNATSQSTWNMEDINALRDQHSEFYNIDGSTPAGAVLVPTETERDIIMDAAKEAPLLAMSDRRIVGWRARRFPRGEFIGVAPPRKEGDAYLMKDVTPSQQEIKIGNYGFIMSHPNEYADDAFGFQAHLSDVIAPVMGETFEEYALKGENGETNYFNQAGAAVVLDLTTQDVPLGLLNETADYVTPTTAAALTHEALVALRYGVRPQARGGGMWYGSSDFLQKVELLKDNDGRPLWQWSIQEGQPDRLYGRSAAESEVLGDVATGETPVFFGRFQRAHKAFIRRGMTVRRSQHYHFGNNSEALAVDMRWGAGVLHKNQLSKLTIT